MRSIVVPGRGRISEGGRGGLGRHFWLQWVLASAVAASVG